MGVGCSFRAVTPRHSSAEEDPILRWRGHELYADSPNSSDPSLGSMSPTRQRLSDEIKALYTCNQTETLTIIHFNDVYNIESCDGRSGGAARFATVVKAYADRNPLILFSGDCLNPSMMSTFTKGKHMVPVLNALRVNTAVYGNHDFDFGVDELEDIVRETRFPWLLSNVIDDFTGEMLADGQVTRLITWQNKKIGLIGLVEEEWLVTLATVDRENVTYLDYAERGEKLASGLKEQGADLVIALTHMRMPNDVRLAEQTSSIDLILAGHDHDYCVDQVNGIHIVKSGSDFKSLSIITMEFTPHRTSFLIKAVEVDEEITEDEEMKQIVDSFEDIVSKEMDEKLGVIEVDLDARFSAVRTQETNLGNLVADVMMSALEVDAALLNSGTFRSDRIHPAGEFRKRDLCTLLPLIDPLMVLQVTGDQLFKALENGVSQYPKREGRFPQVSGMKYAFYPSAPPGQRVDPLCVEVDGECILPDKTYRLCTKEYIATGRDGYKIFCDCPVLVNAEEGPVLSTVVQNHFHSAGVVRGLKPCRSGHRQSLVSLNRKPSLVKSSSLVEVEQARARIAPQVEGRITLLEGDGDDWLDTLAAHRKLFLSGSNADVLAEWQRLHKQTIDANDNVIAENANTVSSARLPGLCPTVIIHDAGTEESGDTDSKGSIASPSASVISIAEEEGCEILHSAIRMDDVNTVSHLLHGKGGSINLCQSLQGTTPLHLAARFNSVQTMQYLLSHVHIDINSQQHKDKKTALMVAAACGHSRVVELLLEAGADVTTRDAEGNTAAAGIAKGSNSSELRRLLEQSNNSRENVPERQERL